jgi:hypothetical protein
MLLHYTNINRIFEKVNKMRPEGFNEIDIIHWTGEALEQMSIPKLYEEAVCYKVVENYQVSLPPYFHNIIQIAKDTSYEAAIIATSICDIAQQPQEQEESKTPEPETVCCDPRIPSCYYYPTGDGHPVIINQLGEPLTEYDLAFYRPYSSWDFTNMSKTRFTPIRLAENNFFQSVLCQTEDAKIYNACEDEYKIVDGSLLRFSFPECGVVIAHLKTRTDEDGYPLIPDDVSVITAIVSYIRWQYALNDFYAYRQGAESRVTKSESDWHWYCKQATNKYTIPSSIDEWQNLMEQRDYLIQRNNYYGFFGHLGKAELRDYLTNTNKR